MENPFAEVTEMVSTMLESSLTTMVAYAPKLLSALVVLLVGWVLARVLRAVLQRSLQVALDSLVERAGLSETLERAAITTRPSALVAGVGFWLVLLLVFMATARILGLGAVGDAITRLLGYVPSVVSAVLVLAGGGFLARFVGDLVASGAGAANISNARGLGAVTRGAIVVMVGVVTLEQLGVDTQIVITVVTVFAAAIAFGMGLSFALGARPLVQGILAGHYLRQHLPEGVELQAGDSRGVLQEIGPTHTVLRSGDQTYRVPNSRLTEETIQH